MKRTLLLQASLSAAIAFSSHALEANEMTSQKERYKQAMRMLSGDAPTALVDLTSLCSEGFARACDRVGYLTFKGVGTPQNTNSALAFYQKAVDAGRTATLVSIGKVQLKAGDYQKATESFLQAVEAGHEKGSAMLAWAHATKRLGHLSEAALGVPVLLDLAVSGQPDAELLLLDAVSRTKNKRINVDPVLDSVRIRWREGDSKAAEALLRYFRMVGHKTGTHGIRASLLETPGLRNKIRVEEALYLSAVRKPGSFWAVSESVVRNAPNDVFARALVVSSKINKNAYVRIVQKELRALGYPVGRPSPYMNRPLIRSINAFCRDTGKSKACLAGPLKSSTIKAVAAQLALVRSET